MVSNENQDDIKSKTDSFKNEYYLTSDKNQMIEIHHLKDHVHEIYIETSKEWDSHVHIAKVIESSGQKRSYNFNEDFIFFLNQENLKCFHSHTKRLLKIIQNLPGFLDFEKDDLKIIMNTHFFTTLCLTQIKLYRNKDFYYMMGENVQLNWEIFKVMFNERVSGSVFCFFSCLKSLDLTEKELGLLIPFVLSSIYFNLENKNLMKERYEYYCRVLFHEFKSNKRTVEFMVDFTKFVCLGQQMNKLIMDASSN
ncbi:unnamed protein product [Brachionus calyciflorus]|uniref:NR LBD domain-containing protein n=1 Tax=Brachionus calyciflorus TaxID=104777 RepID=A0A813M395_9BILA|nr:unnamed protein product [Brachionus calyciflorus]